MESGIGFLVGLRDLPKEAAQIQAHCLTAIDAELARVNDFQWVPREGLEPVPEAPHPDLQTRDFARANGLAAAVRLEARFRTVRGFSKRLALDVEWTLVGADGRELARVSTSAVSDERVGAAPDKGEARYEPLWAALAHESAVAFADLVAGRPRSR
jgi:hypothetical protein